MHPGSLELIRTYAYVLVLVSAAFTTHGLRTISQLPITPGSRVVDSAESFKTALLDNVQHIIFSGNVTLDSTLFPEVPINCLETNPVLVCQPDAVVYGNSSDWPRNSPAIWEADGDSIPWLDVRWLRAAIVIARQIKIVNIRITQMFNDAIPYNFGFVTVETGAVTFMDSFLWSPCGDRDPRYILTTLLRSLNYTAQYSVVDSIDAIRFTDSKSFRLYDTVNQGVVQLINTDIQCYNDTEYTFATREVPSSWIPGSSTVGVRNDSCQRQRTEGADYRGTVATTTDGQPCQSWGVIQPKDHTRSTTNYPYGGLGDHNYCRNPDNTPDGVWCYINNTDASADRWGYCAVPFCDEILPWETPSIGVPTKDSNTGNIVLYIAVPAAIVAFLVFLFIVCQARRRSNKNKHKALTDVSIEGAELNNFMDSANNSNETVSRESGGQVVQRNAAVAPVEELREALHALGFSDQQLKLESEIGRGAYGVVYLGVWKGMKVAVKKILFQDVLHRTQAGPAGLHRAYAEAAIAFTLNHPNVVSTYHHEVKEMRLQDPMFEGSSTPDDTRTWNLFLVQEFCNGGNLATAIQHKFFVSEDGVSPHLPHIFQVAWEMACALQYIHSENIIHGDLNPNNVLLKSALTPSVQSHKSSAEANSLKVYSDLGKGFSVKLADFGLSMKMDAQQTHFSNMRQGTPFYVAPEVQSEGRLNKSSDVFPFGVLLWELYNSKPCFQKTQGDFFVRNAQFPRFPNSCPLPYAVLAVACLHPLPSARPSLDMIISMLQEMLMGDGQVGKNVRPQVINPEQPTPEWQSYPIQEEPRSVDTHQRSGGFVESVVFVTNQTTSFNSLPSLSPPSHPVSSPAIIPFSEEAWRSVVLEMDRLQGDGPSPEVLADEAMERISEYGDANDNNGMLLSLNRTLDTATELGHVVNHGPETSDDESDDFHDALDEIASDPSLISPRDSLNGMTRETSASRLRTKPPSDSKSRYSEKSAATSLSPYYLLMMKQSSLSKELPSRGPSPPKTRPGSMDISNPQHPSDPIHIPHHNNTSHGSRWGGPNALVPTSIPNSGLSGMSDWDAMSAQNELVEDLDTGKTHFRHMRRTNNEEEEQVPSGFSHDGSAIQSTTPTLDRLMSGELPPKSSSLATPFENTPQLDKTMIGKVAQSMGAMYARGSADQPAHMRDVAGRKSVGVSPAEIRKLEMMVGSAGSGGAAKAPRIRSGSNGSSIGEFLIMPDVPQMSRSFLSTSSTLSGSSKLKTVSALPDVHNDSSSDSDTTERSLLHRPVIRKTGRYVVLSDDSSRKQNLNTSFPNSTGDVPHSYIGSRPGNVAGASVSDARALRSGEYQRISSGDVNGPNRVPFGSRPSSTSRPTSITRVREDDPPQYVRGMTSRDGTDGMRVTPLPAPRSDVGPGGGMRFASGSFVSMTSTGEGYVTNHVAATDTVGTDSSFQLERRRWIDPLDDARTMHSEYSDVNSAKGLSVRGEFRPMRILASGTRSASYDRGLTHVEKERSVAVNNGLPTHITPPRSMLFDTMEDDDASDHSEHSPDASLRKVTVTDVVTHGWATVEADADKGASASLPGVDAARLNKAGNQGGGDSEMDDDMASYGFGGMPSRSSVANGANNRGGGATDAEGYTSEEGDSPLSMRGLHSIAPHSAPHFDGQDFNTRAAEIDLNPAKSAQQMADAQQNGSLSIDAKRIAERYGLPTQPSELKRSLDTAVVRRRDAPGVQAPSPELHKFVHPVLRNNKAAMAHVRQVGRPGADVKRTDLSRPSRP